MYTKKILMTTLALAAPLSLMAQESDALAAPSTDLTRMLVMLGIGLAFFYFILWRPEQKRRKVVEDQRAALKKGDKVNAMGIIGTVSKVNENTVILRMVDGAKIEMLKAAISEILTSDIATETESSPEG